MEAINVLKIGSRNHLLWVAVLTLGIASTVIYSFFIGRGMAERYSPMVYAAMEIKLETTSAHLWFEEIISGDPFIDIEDVWKHLDQAEWYARAMLEGGVDQKGRFVPLQSPTLRRMIEQVIDGITAFRTVAQERWELQSQSGVGSDIDQLFDRIFDDFLVSADAVDMALHKTMESQFRQFRILQTLLVIIIMVLGTRIGFLLLQHDRRHKDDLLKLKKEEEKLRESEDKYRKLFEQSADAILIIEGNKFVDCNLATVKMLGYASKKEFLDTHPSELSPQMQPDGRNSLEKANEILATAFDKGSQRFEWDHRRQNGEIFPVEVLLTPVSFGERNFLHVVWRDITERKQAEKALIESEKRFRGLLETSPDGIVIVNAKGSIELVNHKLRDMTGYEPDDLVGQAVEILIPERFKNHMQLRDDYLANAHVRIMGEGEVELFVRRKDGNEFPAEISLSPFEAADGIGISAAIRDITERKQINEVLTYQANHDALTGLVNRREFERRVERLLSTVRQKADEHALCYMDLDEFKLVNDTCGHTAGDEMLQQISMLLQQGVRKRDTLARLGGDEFGVLMEHCTLQQARRVADSLQKTIQDFQFSWEEHVFKVGVSIGLVAITGDTSDLTELMKQADAACYMAKDLGRNRIHIYREGD